MEQETVLITFGAGDKGWKDAAKRVRRDAIRTKLFSDVEIFDENWIQDFDPDLWALIQGYLSTQQKRGFGYWMWKPALLKWADEKWPNKQILYVDAGFHIDRNNKLVAEFGDFLMKSFEIGGIAFEQVGLQDECWTKQEIFDFFKYRSQYKKNNQLYAGFILMPPSEVRKQFTFQFYNLTKHENGFLFNDSITCKQSDRFIETRHDQSIFSILWRNHGLATSPDLTKTENINKFLFISARNKTGLPANIPKYLLKMMRGVNRVRSRDFKND